jgi:uncharacterized membrane protein
MIPNLRIRLTIVAILTAVIVVVDVVGDAVLSLYGMQWARFPFRLSVAVVGVIVCFIIIITWRPNLLQRRRCNDREAGDVGASVKRSQW